MAIHSFSCPDTEELFTKGKNTRFANIKDVATRKLTQQGATMFENGMRPVHPGEVLREDYLKPLGMTANALAKALHVPASRINDIVLERRGITPDTALRLTRYFGGEEADAQGWINMQATYNFKVAQKAVAKVIAKEVQPRDAREAAAGGRR